MIDAFFSRSSKSMSPKNNESENEKITEYEVRNAIAKLNRQSAPGIDGLPSTLYTTQSKFYIPILTSLFNNLHQSDSFPISWKTAVIKLIKKKTSSVQLKDFRPISLINTDLKILAHVLAERVKEPLNELIGTHQSAYLPNRNIHAALTKLRKASYELDSNNCLVAIDFSKAFDSIDRSYLFKMIDKLKVSNITKTLIKALYHETLSIIEIDGSLSLPINIHKGVRQGCPLSALLFILCIEPLLNEIETDNNIISKHQNKIIAYADDVTACIEIKSLTRIFLKLKAFKNATGLDINMSKTEIATDGQLPTGFNRSEKLDVLGVPLWPVKKRISEIHNKLKTKIEEASKISLPSMSLRARALNIGTFVISKITHMLRHLKIQKSMIKSLNAKLVNQFWLSRKHNVNKEILSSTTSCCGIGLKNLLTSTITSKIMNLKFLAFTESEHTFLENLKRSKFFRQNFTRDIVQKPIKEIIINKNQLEIKCENSKLTIEKDTTSKKVYEFLSKESNKNIALQRINQTASKFKINPNNLSNLISKLWKNKQLRSFDKNIIYCFFMNAYFDKKKKWTKNLIPHPICFQCEGSFETFEHLMLECPSNKDLREKLSITDWTSIIQNPENLKFLTATLLSSWTEEEGKYLKYLRQKHQ